MVRDPLSSASEKHPLHSEYRLHVGLPPSPVGGSASLPSVPGSVLDLKQCLLLRRICGYEYLRASENVRVIKILKKVKK